MWLNIINHNLSSAIARRLGFKKEGVLGQCLFVNGPWRDSTHFAMLEDDYDFAGISGSKKSFSGSRNAPVCKNKKRCAFAGTALFSF